MKANNLKKQYKFKNSLSQFFNNFRGWIIVTSLILIVGIILGVVKAIRYSGDLELSNMSDSNLVEFLKGDRGTMGLFFPYMFSFLLCGLIIIVFNFKPFMKIFTYLIFVVKGYLLGFDITILIVLYSFTGIINVIVFILPFELMTLFILIIIASISIKRNMCLKKYGCAYLNINLTKFYLFTLIIGILILLLKCLLMPLIRVTIIVV